MLERHDFGDSLDRTAVVVTMVDDAAPAGAGEPSTKEAWERVRRRLRAELGEDVFSSWFARLELAGILEGVAYLTVPTRFLKSWLEAHYAERLRLNCAAELPAPSS